jgi:hypothetical protein
LTSYVAAQIQNLPLFPINRLPQAHECDNRRSFGVRGRSVSAGLPELYRPAAEAPSTLEHTMSDPIAQAAEALSAAPVTGNVLVNETPVVAAPVVEAGTADMGESQTSSQAPASPQPSSSEPQSLVSASEQSAAASGSLATAQDSGELPRESHLMLLEAKFANALAKLRNAERVSVDELEAIYVHIKAVI